MNNNIHELINIIIYNLMNIKTLNYLKGFIHKHLITLIQTFGGFRFGKAANEETATPVKGSI